MATKEHIEQAKRDVNQIFDDLLANFEEEKYAIITNAYWENGKIVVEYETNIDIDVRYWFGGKVHEAEDYVGKIEQTGRFEIGVNQFDKDWNVQLVGEVDSEVWNVGAYKTTEPPIEEPEPSGILGRNWKWKKVFTPNDVSGTKRIKATGYAEYEDDLYLMINSRPTSGPRSQTGSLVKTDLNEFEWLGEVLNETDQDWQGTQRVMPACLYRIDDTYYTYFIDKPDHWNGEYWGGRAIGLATSKNLIDWNYHDKPVFSAETFHNLTGLGDINELQSRGQVYIWGGWVHEGWQYFFIDTSVLRDNSDHELGRICVRHNGDLNWEKVDCDYNTDSAPLFVDGKWYRAWKSKKDGKRSIGIYESNEMLKGYELAEHVAVDVQSTGAIVHPQLIFYKGRFAVTWSEYDGDGQNLFISVSD